MKPSNVLSHPALYRLWQAPFATQKLRPVMESGIPQRARRVLDVGCGPGTNSTAFATAAKYVGVDIDESYIAYASKHFTGDFRVADVTTVLPTFGEFDLILINSLMHHMDDEGSRWLLRALPPLLASGGEVHIIDLVRSDVGIPHKMALLDRGKFPRTTTEWKEMIQPELSIRDIRRFDVGLGPFRLWELIHVRATALTV